MGNNLAELPPVADPAAQGIEARPTLVLVPDFTGLEPPTSQAVSVIDANAIPGLRFARLREANEADRILDESRQRISDGQADTVPMAVDPLGTAREVVEAKRRSGPDSPEYHKKLGGLVLDSQRLLGEVFSKNNAEYFEKVLQERQPDTGEYLTNGFSTRKMVSNGLSPKARVEVLPGRVNDFVEEGTYEAIGSAIGRIGLRDVIKQWVEPVAEVEAADDSETPVLNVVTILECPDYAIEDFKLNPKGSHEGLVPSIEKMMIRGMSFLPSGDRYEDQVAVSGLYITHDVITEVLAEKGIIAEGEQPTKTEIQAKQLINANGEGVMDLVKELDQKASEKSGQKIFMGEVVADDHELDYEAFVEAAEIRRQKLAPKPKELAEYLISLEENGTDKHEAEALVHAYLKETLLEVVRHNPELAEAAFDKETAEGFAKVARLKAAGRHEEADWLQAEVEENAPEVSYCGAGCGLESVNPRSPAGQKAQKIGLNGELLHDTERPCPECKEMTVYYGSNGKACIGCGHNDVGAKSEKKSQ